jgi:hypothetical protein
VGYCEHYRGSIRPCGSDSGHSVYCKIHSEFIFFCSCNLYPRRKESSIAFTFWLNFLISGFLDTSCVHYVDGVRFFVLTSFISFSDYFKFLSTKLVILDFNY